MKTIKKTGLIVGIGSAILLVGQWAHAFTLIELLLVISMLQHNPEGRPAGVPENIPITVAPVGSAYNISYTFPGPNQTTSARVVANPARQPVYLEGEQSFADNTVNSAMKIVGRFRQKI